MTNGKKRKGTEQYDLQCVFKLKRNQTIKPHGDKDIDNWWIRYDRSSIKRSSESKRPPSFPFESTSIEAYPLSFFKWDIASGYIDPRALKVDVIIHLSGEGIANKRWTEKQKQKLIVSRIDAAQLLYDQVVKLKMRPTRIISASAIGYYGSDTQKEECFENNPAGDDFIGQFVCKWEQQVNQFEALGIRVSLLRIGIVLSKAGGALPKLTLPILWGVGAPIGSGRQSMSWIHLDDLVKMFVFVVERQVLGIYNAVTQNTTNALLTQAIAKQLKRPLFLPNIP